MTLRMSDALSVRRQISAPSATCVVGVLPGEGIGPEIVDVALHVLDILGAAKGKRFDVRIGGPIGKEALSLSGKSLTEDIVDFCDGVFNEGGALFCGAGGARFVYDLRERFDLFCKFTPLDPIAALKDIGPLRPELLKNIDIVAVRENVGGLYFGDWGRFTDNHGGISAYHRFEYRRKQVERILVVAARLAAMRSGKMCVVIKREGVPAISQLWLECMENLAETDAMEVTVLDIDNAVYQLIAHPSRFDVIVSSNMFGDVLADCGGLLLGSRGLSHSGNFSTDGKAVYQTGHGAAHDIAGSDRANPLGQILALAMMLDESFGWREGGQLIRAAVAEVLVAGWRTPDIAASDSRIVGTRELGRHIGEALERLATETPCDLHSF
jgi:3-isopropylmalate dehydrogenase